jgi:hypothetical protein
LPPSKISTAQPQLKPEFLRHCDSGKTTSDEIYSTGVDWLPAGAWGMR